MAVGVPNGDFPSRAQLRRARAAEDAARREVELKEASARQPVQGSAAEPVEEPGPEAPTEPPAPETPAPATRPAPKAAAPSCADPGTVLTRPRVRAATQQGAPDAAGEFDEFDAVEESRADDADIDGAPTATAEAEEAQATGPEAEANTAPETATGQIPGTAESDTLLTPPNQPRETFLRPDDGSMLPPEQGLRGVLAGFGVPIEPSKRELRERKWRGAVAKRLERPRTISVVNGKGGANKTPTAVLLSAVFGRHSGDPVLAWDNNGTRGTLGWRTGQGGHNAHSMDLLRAAPDLENARAGDRAVNAFVHYQPEDRFSVLRTDPTLLASEQHLNAGDFDALHATVARFFRLTVVDSGNDESAERWMRMIDHTDQLVIASTTVEEHAEAGALLLEGLAQRGGHYAELARNAVVVVSQHQQRGSNEQLRRVARGFARLARAVVTVPYDPALVKGPIRFDALRPATRRAWLEAAAAVSGGLS
ncbi:MinD/ParA family ATP-binding protein [Arthrobacter sp. KK5.5]|uniref:MinD/ParA family ATP-binding protein n=1 Tax=Arthrobacter sp. KK5.5 TaxID=3373084 RepID=UPI003EE57C70